MIPCTTGSLSIFQKTLKCRIVTQAIHVASPVSFSPLFQETGPLCACLGGAYRAIHALKAADNNGGGEAGLSFSDAVEADADENLGSKSWKPQKDASSVYKPLMERYRALEQRILSH